MSADSGAASRDLPTAIGRYNIRTRLAADALCDVYHGFDPLIERPVVVKTFHLSIVDAAAQEVIKRTFYAEVQRTGVLMHHGIAALFDAGDLPGGVFIASEYMDGVSLAELVARGEAFDLPTRAALLTQMGDALSYAHQMGVLHGNLGPTHVIVAPDQMLKLSGFGVAPVVDALADAAGLRRRTPSRHVAPERARGDVGDVRSDVYSLASLALDVLQPPGLAEARASGEVPSLPEYLAAQGVSPAGWSDVFTRALSPRAPERFSSPVTLMMDLFLVLGIGGAESGALWERPALTGGEIAGAQGAATDDLDATAATVLGGVGYTPAGPRHPAAGHGSEDSTASGAGDDGGQTMLAPRHEVQTHTALNPDGGRPSPDKPGRH